MTNNWVKHFSDMSQGLIPYQKKFYKIQPQTGMGDIQLVTPTEADVQRAKSDMKRKLTESIGYKPKRLRLSPQSGAGQKKKNKKKSPAKKKKPKSKTKKTTKPKKKPKSKTKKTTKPKKK